MLVSTRKRNSVNFNPRLSANRPSNNWALGSTGKNFSKWNLKVWLLFLGLKRLASESDLWREFYWSEPAALYWPYVTLMLFFSSVECVFASTQYQNNNGPVSIPKTIFSHWKFFLVVCWYGWQRWTWIKTWKSWANFFKFNTVCKNHEKIL